MSAVNYATNTSVTIMSRFWDASVWKLITTLAIEPDCNSSVCGQGFHYNTVILALSMKDSYVLLTPLLPTWININPSMDKLPYAQ